MGVYPLPSAVIIAAAAHAAAVICAGASETELYIVCLSDKNK